MKAIVASTLLALAVVATAIAPAAAQHVDPQAPCYRWPAVDMDGDGVFDRVDHCVSTPKGCTVDQWGCHSDADGDGVCDGVDRCPSTPAGAKVDPAGCSEAQLSARTAPPPPKPQPTPEPVRPATEAEKKLAATGRLRLDDVNFESGSARLLPESEEPLRQLGEGLKRYPTARVEIEGHTDTRGAADYNMRLSQARAETVRTWLIEHFNIDPSMITAKGYGETMPETAERNEQELLRNRRVELRLLNPEVLPANAR